jgi:peptidoglycan/LPS O-acetylase OafA/YrhL
MAFSRAEWKEKLRSILSGRVIVALVAIDVLSNVIHGHHNYSAYEPLILSLLLVWPVLHPESLFRRILDSSPLMYLGSLSYSLYIWQEFWFLFPTAPPLLGRAQSFPLNVVAAFACAAGSYYLIEQPFIELGRRLQIKRKAPLVSSGARAQVFGVEEKTMRDAFSGRTQSSYDSER